MRRQGPKELAAGEAGVNGNPYTNTGVAFNYNQADTGRPINRFLFAGDF